VSSTLTALITLFLVGLVPLAPTEPVLVGMGVFAASGHLPLVWVIAVAAVSCSISDHLLYALGRVAGVRVLRRLSGKPSVTAANEWLSARITKWGAPILVVGRWLPAGGTIGSVLTGTLRWRLVRFSPSSVLGALLWSTYVALIGYFGGAITGQPLTGLLLSLGIAAVLGIGFSIVIQRSHHRTHGHSHDTKDAGIGEGTLIAR
jgi:membrane protein DedA with SNARE-associated domain